MAGMEWLYGKQPELMGGDSGDGVVSTRRFLLSSLQPALRSRWSGRARRRHAEDDFYSGKTIQVLIGFSSGGGYDLYGRTLARYLGRHIPGNPQIVPQNMPGAGSLKLVNYLYNVAPKDGTAIGIFAPGIIAEPLLGHGDGTQFDATKFGWLGSVSQEVSVCAFMASTGIASLAGYAEQSRA